MPRYPWAVRAGGPLLQGGGGDGALTPIFDWNEEIAQELPLTSSFARAAIKNVLTTTDGTTIWNQPAGNGELVFFGMRRVQNFVDQTVSNTITQVAGAGSAPIFTENFAQDPSGAMTATRMQLEAGATGPADFSGIQYRRSSVTNNLNYAASIYLKLNTGTSRDIQLIDLSSDTTITVTDSWQRFAGNGVSASSRFTLGVLARGNISGAAEVDLLVAEGTLNNTQFEPIRTAADAPSEFVERLTVYNAEVVGVRYFNTTNANSVSGGLVTETPGSTIIGGGWRGEPAATNRLLQSTDMTQAAWTASGAVVPTNLGITDVGEQVSQVAGLGALGVDDISQSVAGFTASGVVAPSVLFQRVSTTGTLRIVNAAGGAANGEWQVDLSLVGANWVRLEPGVAIPGFSEVTPWGADGGGNAGLTYHAAAGGPLTVNLTFNGMENTIFATSSIRTVGATLSRVADSLTDVTWPTASSAVVDVTVNGVVPGTDDANRVNMLGFSTGSNRNFQIDGPTVLRLFNGGINSFTVASSSYENERHGFGMSLAINVGIVVDDEDNDNTDPTGTPTQGTIYVGLNSSLVGVPSTQHRTRIYDQIQTIDELKALV